MGHDFFCCVWNPCFVGDRDGILFDAVFRAVGFYFILPQWLIGI